MEAFNKTFDVGSEAGLNNENLQLHVVIENISNNEKSSIDFFWELSIKLHKNPGLVSFSDIFQIMKAIIRKYPKINSVEWNGILSAVKSHPGINELGIVDKGFSLQDLIDIEEEQSRKGQSNELLYVTIMLNKRFYNIGGLGLFWLVLNDLVIKKVTELNEKDYKYFFESIAKLPDSDLNSMIFRNILRPFNYSLDEQKVYNGDLIKNAQSYNNNDNLLEDEKVPLSDMQLQFDPTVEMHPIEYNFEKNDINNDDLLLPKGPRK